MSDDVPMVVIPGVAGVLPDVASQRLANADLTPGGQIGQASDRITGGFVLGTEPPEGESVPVGTRVDLVVSTGHAPTGIVPDASGVDFETAAGILGRDGYTASKDEQLSSTVDAGIAIRTSPPAGTPLSPGSDVIVIISLGFHPPEPPKRPDQPPETLPG